MPIAVIEINILNVMFAVEKRAPQSYLKMKSTDGKKQTILMKKVLLIPKLDRRLFLVAAFVKIEGNSINFDDDITIKCVDYLTAI